MNRRREILTEPKCRAKIWVWNRSLKKPIRKSGKRLEELKKLEIDMFNVQRPK